MSIRLVLDTDIGTDVDDCLALAVILASPEFTLEGITCVYGDVQLRVRMIRKLLRLAGRDTVPVMAGIEQTYLGDRSIYWGGHEGVGLLDPEDADLASASEHAVDYLIRTVLENPGEIHLLAIGPLTNVAVAIRREPRFATSLQHLTIMGGVVRLTGDLDLPYAEHNIVCDPEAAKVVLASGAPMTLIPLDVTTKVQIRQNDVAQIEAAGTPFHAAVAQQVSDYPRFAAKGATQLHDPLAAAVILRPDLVEFTDLHVDVETRGQFTAGMTLTRTPSHDRPATAAVALRVDTPAAERFIVDRIASAASVASAAVAG